MKGYSAVSTQVTVPSDGAGVLHDFVLPCTSCQDDHGQAEMKDAYMEEVTFAECPAWFVMCMTDFTTIDMCTLFGFEPCVGVYRCYQLSPGKCIQAQRKLLPCKHDSDLCIATMNLLKDIRCLWLTTKVLRCQSSCTLLLCMIMQAADYMP